MLKQDVKKLPSTGVNRILIRGTNWIGDAVLTLAALSAVRNAYPRTRISILAKPWVADVYRLSQLAEEVVIYEEPGRHAGLGGIFRLAGELNGRGFDMAILLQNAIEAALIARFAGIAVRAGYNTDARGLLLTHPVPITPALKKIHQADYYLKMVQALGCGKSAPGPFLRLTAEDEKAADRLLKDCGLEGKTLAGMAPGATYGPAKKWFPERFGALAERLQDDYDVATVMFGSAGDRETTASVQKSSRYSLVDLAGKTDLRTAIAVMARCRLFVSNDSGLMHIAGALDIPTIALFGSTNPATTSPLGERSIVIYRGAACSPCLRKVCPTDFCCMDAIAVEEVYQIAQGILCKG